jgi:hypothetical protein
MMTETQKIEQLQELLSTVIFALEMTQYEIEDATQSHNVVQLADAYHQKMIDILHSDS